MEDELRNAYAETCALEKKYGIPYAVARSLVDGSFKDKYISGENKSVLNDWVVDLTLMQQSVLLSLVRNADGIPKFHKQKALIRWYRRCILKSAFEGAELRNPQQPGGGSFTGPVDDVAQALDDFIDSRDEMSLHYFAHAMHAFEILGYKHPDSGIRTFWNTAYVRMVHCLHIWPETEEQLDKRLGDNETGWRERNDPSSTCSD